MQNFRNFPYWIPIIGPYLPNNPYPDISKEKIDLPLNELAYSIWHNVGVPLLVSLSIVVHNNPQLYNYFQKLF